MREEGEEKQFSPHTPVPNLLLLKVRPLRSTSSTPIYFFLTSFAGFMEKEPLRSFISLVEPERSRE